MESSTTKPLVINSEVLTEEIINSAAKAGIETIEKILGKNKVFIQIGVKKLKQFNKGAIIKPLAANPIIKKTTFTPFQSIVAVAIAASKNKKCTIQKINKIDNSAFNLFESNNYYGIMKKINQFLKDSNLYWRCKLHCGVHLLIDQANNNFSSSYKINQNEYSKWINFNNQFGVSYLELYREIDQFIPNSNFEQQKKFFIHLNIIIEKLKLEKQKLILNAALSNINDGVERVTTVIITHNKKS